jgi:hypothetical protein
MKGWSLQSLLDFVTGITLRLYCAVIISEVLTLRGNFSFGLLYNKLITSDPRLPYVSTNTATLPLHKLLGYMHAYRTLQNNVTTLRKGNVASQN